MTKEQEQELRELIEFKWRMLTWPKKIYWTLMLKRPTQRRVDTCIEDIRREETRHGHNLMGTPSQN